jgi:hypothetical protein
MRLIPVLILIAASGCHTGACSCIGHSKYSRCWDNLWTKCDARSCARADLRKMEHDCSKDCDYRAGYEQAYVDVALGACGDVPALPPAHYWKNRARTPKGHQKSERWFAGYNAGAPRARCCYDPYNVVASSGVPGYEWSRTESSYDIGSNVPLASSWEP